MWWIFVSYIFLSLARESVAQEQVSVPPVQEVPLNMLEYRISHDTSIQDQDVATSLDLGNQHFLLNNGDPQEKLDILFIPWRISDLSSLPALVEKLFFVDDSGAYDGLFMFPPFSENQQKFNVSYVDKNIDEDFFHCYVQVPQPGDPPGWYLNHECSETLVKEGYTRFQPDYIVILFDLPLGYHSTGGEIMYLESDAGSENGTPELQNYVAWVFVHEFAHQFGGLADEYTYGSRIVSTQCGYDDPTCFDRYYERAIKAVPNVDQVGCPKWCTEYNLLPLIAENAICAGKLTEEECLGDGSTCNWFANPHPALGTRCVISYSWVATGTQCTENIACYLGADYAPLAFRPAIDSIMSGGQSFNTPSEAHLKKALECCYPKSDTADCQQFRASISNPDPETNYHLAKALRKIASCPAIGECERSIKSLVQQYGMVPSCAGFDANIDGKQNALDIAVEMWL